MNNSIVCETMWESVWEPVSVSVSASVRGSVVYSAWSSNITKFPAVNSVEIIISIATEEYVRNEL